MFPEGRDYFLCTLDKNLGSCILSWDIKIKNISIQKMILFFSQKKVIQVVFQGKLEQNKIQIIGKTSLKYEISKFLSNIYNLQ
jgi:hypothetical protein